jgi:hypothetical protein
LFQATCGDGVQRKMIVCVNDFAQVSVARHALRCAALRCAAAHTV